MGHIPGANSGNLELVKRIKELEAKVEELNSNISGNFMYKLRQSTVSFKDADNTTDTTGYAGYLDAKLHPSIDNYDMNTHMFIGDNNGPLYFILLGKMSDSYYAGQIWSYASITGTVFFAYRSGTYSIYKPISIL